MEVIWEYRTFDPVRLVASWHVAALKIEKIKKEKNIKTYKEIVAYMECEDVEERRKERSFGKDFLSQTVIVIVFTITVMAVVLASLWLSGMF